MRPPLNILVVGSGGREHALAWKLAQSPRLRALYVAPGNAGTEGLPSPVPVANLPVPADDLPALVQCARERQIDLALIGPEGPLAAGLADALQAAGVLVFGPSQAAARIESSKAFAKAFMLRHGLPTARYAVFTDFYQAIGHLLTLDYPVVIKASGLAAGKGVIVPDCADDAEAALRQIMLEREFGAAGDEVVIEERLTGEEVSLLAFSDGTAVRAMPPAQDHKRLLAGDRGPNTGGMGAYAPALLAPETDLRSLPAVTSRGPAAALSARMEDWTLSILQPAVDGLRAEGRPFVGVLYAGVMLTPAGPRVLEFNCRFGDPETQVLLPLLETDLVDIAEACAQGRLAEVAVRWRPGAAACVVLAAEGYPGPYPQGRVIAGLDTPLQEAVLFHAGTARAGERVVTTGGRVLAAAGWGLSLPAALERAYRAAKAVHFEGMHYRTDIGWRAVSHL